MKNMIAALLVSVSASLCFAQAAKPLTNSDVVSMLKAGLPESTVLMSIRAGPTAFDTSPQALIALKKSGVPPSVIEAMIRPGPASSAPPAPSAAASPRPVPQGLEALASRWGTRQSRIEVDRVFLVDAEHRTEMKYSQPGTRSRYIVFVAQQFAVLNGSSAKLRTTNRQPQFELILPNNVEVSGLVAVAKLERRSNGSREIMISNMSGFGASSAGFPAERYMRVSYDKAGDQTGSPEGYDIYRVRVTDPLQPGEYAFVVNTPAHGTMGGFGGASLSYNFYELGVD